MLGAQYLEGRGVSYPVVTGPPPSLQELPRLELPGCRGLESWTEKVVPMFLVWLGRCTLRCGAEETRASAPPEC